MDSNIFKLKNGLEQIKGFEFGFWFKLFSMLFISYIIASICKAVMIRATRSHASKHQSILFGTIVFYIVLFLELLIILEIVDFDHFSKYIVGSAGILTLAVGFAARTPFSNLISGFFLFTEKPFQIGDTIIFEDIEGEVLSIDLLSIKIRTLNNLLVRLPNESILNSKFFNVTAFPIRRIDLKINIKFNQNIDRLSEILIATMRQNVNCLNYPEPDFRLIEIGEYALVGKILVWVEKSKFYKTRSLLLQEIMANLSTNGIEIACPKYLAHDLK